MRGKGITYDTGFFPRGVSGGSSREPFDPEVVRREMQLIRDDLHCNAVRVTGGDPQRLEIAARAAAAAGLEVWFSPFTCDLTADALLDVLADCAQRAEGLRQSGAAVVLVTGAELGLFTSGFLPGDTFEERLALLADPQRLRALVAELPTRINAFLGQAAKTVRKRFGGKLSYAALPFERVDWAPFDVIGVDAYRSAEIADRYRESIRALVATWQERGKPVAITEFGCTTYRGAAEQGARGWMIVEYDSDGGDGGDDDGNGKPVLRSGDFVRDEEEQATYLRELLELFDAEGVDTAFVYTFANYHLLHRDDPRVDLDMASYGVVKVLEHGGGRVYPGVPWEPKRAFAVLADCYGR